MTGVDGGHGWSHRCCNGVCDAVVRESGAWREDGDAAHERWLAVVEKLVVDLQWRRRGMVVMVVQLGVERECREARCHGGCVRCSMVDGTLVAVCKRSQIYTTNCNAPSSSSTMPAPITHNSNNDEQHHHRTTSIDAPVTTNIAAAPPRRSNHTGAGTIRRQPRSQEREKHGGKNPNFGREKGMTRVSLLLHNQTGQS